MKKFIQKYQGWINAVFLLLTGIASILTGTLTEASFTQLGVEKTQGFFIGMGFIIVLIVFYAVCSYLVGLFHKHFIIKKSIRDLKEQD